MTIEDIYKAGYLGIQLKQGVGNLTFNSCDENGEEIHIEIYANQIYPVTYIDKGGVVGILNIDGENSLSYHISDGIWEYTSTYSEILH